jgi:hypothetical protein
MVAVARGDAADGGVADAGAAALGPAIRLSIETLEDQRIRELVRDQPRESRPDRRLGDGVELLVAILGQEVRVVEVAGGLVGDELGSGDDLELRCEVGVPAAAGDAQQRPGLVEIQLLEQRPFMAFEARNRRRPVGTTGSFGGLLLSFATCPPATRLSWSSRRG